MSYDKELEIQRQFLDEAQEYLDTLDSALLEIASDRVDIQKVNAALRAAHSIKGGAGMMGFHTLSDLAHRLEDSFKVLKIQKDSIAIDSDLESLLLSAVDCLRWVITSDRQNQPVDQFWLDTQALPIYEQLHERLGDPQEEDAASILSTDEGQDIIPLLFQTEVEGCLQRLESVLADPVKPCLEEELNILAQELGGLGEMLQLTPFTQLCESVATQLQHASPEQVEAIAEVAIAAWRRSQALVLTGNFDSLPTEIEPTFDATIVTHVETTPEVDDAIELPATAETPAVTETWAAETPAETWNLEIDESVLESFLTQSETDWTSLTETIDWDALANEANNPDWMVVDPDADSALADWANLADDTEASDWAQLAETANLADANLTEINFADADFIDSEEINRVDSEDVNLADADLSDAELANTDPDSDTDLAKHHFTAADFADSNFAEANFSDTEAIADWMQLTEATAEVEAAEIAAEEAPLHPTEIEPEPAPVRRSPQAAGREMQATDFRVLEMKPEPAPAAKTEPDITVRVSLKQLDQINDLMGELTIERNTLDLYLKRIRGLIGTLSRRIQTLDQSNMQLRAAYDRGAIQSAMLAVHPSFVGAAVGATDARSGSDSGSERLSGADQRDDLDPFQRLNHKFDVLEMDRYSDLHLTAQEVMETIVQLQEVTNDLELSIDDTDQTARNLNKTAKQLQNKFNHVRMRPLSDIVDRFPRALRELSLQHHKPVELKIHGATTLIDRNILETLSDPLMHLLRNAFDHGIENAETRAARGKSEKGLIEIRAAHQNTRTVITISDDGGGIPLDKIRARAEQMGLDATLLAAASDEELLSLIFEPGFSTTERVTALSGRGVGMDVVRDHLRKIRGEIKVDTRPGKGTTFTLSVPFTLSIVRVLLAESNGMLMAFPTDAIEEMVLPRADDVFSTAGNEMLNWQGTLVPLVRLSRWLQFNCPQQRIGFEDPPAIVTPTVLMVNHGTQLIGLQIDRSWGEQEVAIRQVEGSIPMPSGFTTCTILGDGCVVPLVNLPDLLQWVSSYERSQPLGENLLSPYASSQRLSLKSADPSPSLLPASKNTILIIDDSINVRRFLALTLEKAGYWVEQAKDGQDALDKLNNGLQVKAAICDIEMPRLDGYDFLARVKSIPTLKALPILMLTSRSGDKHRQLAMSLGATAYFSKPYNEQALLQTLEQVLLVPTTT